MHYFHILLRIFTFGVIGRGVAGFNSKISFMSWGGFQPSFVKSSSLVMLGKFFGTPCTRYPKISIVYSANIDTISFHFLVSFDLKKNDRYIQGVLEKSKDEICYEIL